MRVRVRRIELQHFLELRERQIEEPCLSVSPPQERVQLRCLTYGNFHFVEERRCLRQLLQLQIRKGEAVGDVEIGGDRHGSL